MSRREVMFWTVELLLTECSPRWNTHPLCVGVVGVVSVGGGGGDMWHASHKCWITLTPPHLGQPDVSRLVPLQKIAPKHHSGSGLVIFFRRRCLFNLALIFNGGSQRGWNWETIRWPADDISFYRSTRYSNPKERNRTSSLAAEQFKSQVPKYAMLGTMRSN